MRTVSFSAKAVRAKLAQEFVCTYTNTEGSASTGGSYAHAPHEPAGHCTRGVGQQNVQVIFMTPGGNIFQVGTGFLPPATLLQEMEFALRTFEMLESTDRRSQDPRESQTQLINVLTKRLRGAGYSQSELATAVQPAVQVGPSGIRVTKTGVVGGDDRQCLLRDTTYMLRHPLIHYSQFERNPAELVGDHKSFFGSAAPRFGR